MANSANLPAPFRGMDQSTPVAVLQNPFCEKLINFNTTKAGISLRKGCKLAITRPYATYADALGMIEVSSGVLLFTNTHWLIYNGTTFSTVVVTGLASNPNPVNLTYFNNVIYAIPAPPFGTPGQFNLNTSTASAFGFTTTMTEIAGACTYKNRIYFFYQSSFGYSGIDQITGTLTDRNLASVIGYSSSIINMCKLTLTDNLNSEELLCYVLSSGEVLFYSGSYPDGSDWSIRGRGFIGRPIEYNKQIEYNGDTLIITKQGVVSLRQVFTKGDDSIVDFTLSKEVEDEWKECCRLIEATGEEQEFYMSVSASYWKEQNKIVVLFPVDTTKAGADPFDCTGGTAFIYDTLRMAWSIHRLEQFGVSVDSMPSGMARLKEKLLICSGYSFAQDLAIWEYEGATDYQDEAVIAGVATKQAYDYEMLSAPIPFPKNANYETTTIEPILESDLYAQTNWNFVADFGRQTSGDQKTDAGTTSVAKPAVNVGMQNVTYVQVKMSGTTAASKTVGLDLYSYNVWYNAGEIGSR